MELVGKGFINMRGEPNAPKRRVRDQCFENATFWVEGGSRRSRGIQGDPGDPGGSKGIQGDPGGSKGLGYPDPRGIQGGSSNIF